MVEHMMAEHGGIQPEAIQLLEQIAHKIDFRPEREMAFVKKGNLVSIYIYPRPEILGSAKADTRHLGEFRRFNFREVNAVSRALVDIPTSGENVTVLGYCVAEVYRSGKEGYPDGTPYYHFHRSPFPLLLQHNDLYIITGGRMKIKEWIYH